MTGNLSLLHDFKNINGPNVAFGGNPVGGKISGEVPVKCDNLSFEKVNYVKQLNFNLTFTSHYWYDKFSQV